jgi:hypothetical protein
MMFSKLMFQSSPSCGQTTLISMALIPTLTAINESSNGLSPHARHEPPLRETLARRRIRDIAAQRRLEPMEQPRSFCVGPFMSADVIHLKKARGQVAVAGKAHDPGERADVDPIAQLYIRLVYCMAAWNDEGMARAGGNDQGGQASGQGSARSC